MNQELIDMVEQAGFFVKDNEAYSPSVQEDHELTHFLEAFAALVVAAEREACAKVCEDVFTQSQIPFSQGVFTPETCVYLIRARGDKK